MSAFITPTHLSGNDGTNNKTRTFTFVGTSAYDTGGSLIDLSVATLGAANGFTRVDHASVNSSIAKWSGANYIRGASGGATLGKIFVTDTTVADGGDEVLNAVDLSSATFTVQVTGA